MQLGPPHDLSGMLCAKTYKLYQVVSSFYLASSSWTLLGSFLLLDLVFITSASRLRVPRLDFSRVKWAILFALLGVVDWVGCGGWRAVVSMAQWLPILGWLSRAVLEFWNSELTFSCAVEYHVDPTGAHALSQTPLTER